MTIVCENAKNGDRNCQDLANGLDQSGYDVTSLNYEELLNHLKNNNIGRGGGNNNSFGNRGNSGIFGGNSNNRNSSMRRGGGFGSNNDRGGGGGFFGGNNSNREKETVRRQNNYLNGFNGSKNNNSVNKGGFLNSGNNNFNGRNSSTRNGGGMFGNNNNNDRNSMSRNDSSRGGNGGFFTGSRSTSRGGGGGGMFSNRNNSNSNSNRGNGGFFGNNSGGNNNGNNNGSGGNKGNGFFGSNSNSNHGNQKGGMFNNNSSGNNQNGNFSSNNLNQNQNMMPNSNLDQVTNMMGTLLQTQNMMIMNLAAQQKNSGSITKPNFLIRTSGDSLNQTNIPLDQSQHEYDYYLNKAQHNNFKMMPENPLPTLFKKNELPSCNYYDTYPNQISAPNLAYKSRVEESKLLQIQNKAWCDTPIDPLRQLGLAGPRDCELSIYLNSSNQIGNIKSRKNNFYSSNLTRTHNSNQISNIARSPISNLPPLTRRNTPKVGTITSKKQDQPIYLRILVKTNKQKQLIGHKIRGNMVSMTTIKHLKREIFHKMFDALEEIESTNMSLWNELDSRIPDRAHVHLYVPYLDEIPEWELMIETDLAMKNLSKESIEMGLQQGEVGIRVLDLDARFGGCGSPIKIDANSIHESREWEIIGESNSGDKLEDFKPENMFRTPNSSTLLKENLSVIKSAQIRTPITESEEMLTLPKLSSMTINEKRSVQNFMIYNKFGSVQFHQPVDVSNIHKISECVKIGLHSIDIFESGRTPQGEGLNQPCTLKLIDWYNENGKNAYGKTVKDPKSVTEAKSWLDKENMRKELFLKAMKKMAKKMGGQFVQFDAGENIVEIEMDWLE